MRLSAAVRAALASCALGVGAAALGLVAEVWGAPARPLARSARVLSVRDEGRLRYVSSSGSRLLDVGHASGTLPGSVRVRFTYDGEPTVSAELTIYGAGWSIDARASGRLSSPVSATPSFRGSMSITGGSGLYAHARGSGEMFGVFYRRNYALTVQAIGKLRY